MPSVEQRTMHDIHRVTALITFGAVALPRLQMAVGAASQPPNRPPCCRSPHHGGFECKALGFRPLRRLLGTSTAAPREAASGNIAARMSALWLGRCGAWGRAVRCGRTAREKMMRFLEPGTQPPERLRLCYNRTCRDSPPVAGDVATISVDRIPPMSVPHGCPLSIGQSSRDQVHERRRALEAQTSGLWPMTVGRKTSPGLCRPQPSEREK